MSSFALCTGDFRHCPPYPGFLLSVSPSHGVYPAAQRSNKKSQTSSKHLFLQCFSSPPRLYAQTTVGSKNQPPSYPGGLGFIAVTPSIQISDANQPPP